MNKDINLHTLFTELEKKLTNDLERSSNTTNHPGTQGNSTEIHWKTMLENHLPIRYKVSSGFVIDSEGKISQQQDIIIYDRQYSPLLFHDAGNLYIPAESVYAVLEVKPTLNADNVKYAGEKIQSVRDLYRTNTKIIHAGGEYSPRELFKILGGILTFDSSWSPALGNTFNENLKLLSFNGRIDFGCSLKDGSFKVIYDKSSDIKIDIKNKSILLEFFLSLLAKLQALGTVPAIDINAYAKWINDKEVL